MRNAWHVVFLAAPLATTSILAAARGVNSPLIYSRREV